MFDFGCNEDYFDECGTEHAAPRPASASEAVRRELAERFHYYRLLVIRRLRDDVGADEVLQAFALKALERAEQLRDVGAVRGWLRRLLETSLIDFCRRRSAQRQREIVFEAELHDRPSETLSDVIADPVEVIVGLMSSMRHEYADVIRRLDLLGQPKEQAARELNITVNNLTVRAHRARRALRSTIANFPLPRGDASDRRGPRLPAAALAMG